jgi:pSer/pThr/pTyr-binding forkhead associated (FHA) protein
VIVCPRCNKENQDHYKFCLGCGSELPRDAVQAPRDFSEQTPPSGFAAPSLAEIQAPGREPRTTDSPAISKKRIELASTEVHGSDQPPEIGPQNIAPTVLAEKICPTCGNSVPIDFKFCGTCGNSMERPSSSSISKASPSGPEHEAGSDPVSKPASVPVSTAQVSTARGKLVLINPDGSEGSSYPLGAGRTTIGRDAGGPFAGDMYLSPIHATFSFRDGILSVIDENSLNGIYIKIDRNAPIVLTDGAIFRIGQEILRFEEIKPQADIDGVEIMGSPNLGFIGRLCTIIGRDTIGEAFTIPADGTHLGRERGDVTFPEDGYVSGLHCRIYKKGNTVFLSDVGSSNGTFLRVVKEQQLRNGELILIGQQLFSARY